MAIVSDVEIRLRADIARLQQDMNRVRSSVDSTMNQVARAANAARNALIGITAGIGISELANLTDQYTRFTAQLKLATNSQNEYARAIEDVRRISTTAQNDIGATGVLYARIIQSTRELGVSQREVAKVTETVNLALASTGAGAAESASAMLQLSQAFGSGVLRGEEFNAVYEAAPELLRILARDMDIPIGKLRKLAEAGALTSDKLVKAFSNDAVIKGLRENVAQITTISGALTVFKNNLIEIVGTQAHASGSVKLLTTAILGAADAVKIMLGLLGPALKISAAYFALFVVAPPAITATAAAMTRLGHAMAVYAMNVLIGQANTIKFNQTLFGTSVAADLASGKLTKLGLSLNVLFAGFVGWEIGKYIESQFVEVEIAAEVMTGELLKAWQVIKFAFKDAFDAMTVFAREAVSKIASILSSGQEVLAKGFRLIGDERMASAIETYAAGVRKAAEVESTYSARSAERRTEMEKQIRLIDLDTSRRSDAALVRTRISESAERDEVTVAAATAKSAEASKQAAAEAKKQADAYRDLIRTLQDRADATALEAAGLPALTTAQQAHIDLYRQLADGKIKLSKVREVNARSLINEASANDVLTRSMKEWNDLQQQLADNARDLAQDRAALIKSAEEEAKQNEFLVETFGMTESAIMLVQAARLKEQEAQRLGRDLNAEEIEDLNRVIELKERSARAVANRGQLEQTRQFWTDIEKTAHDTFVSITDGGKSAFQRLKDTAKNTFFDWLYQQTLKKWIVNIQANTSTSGIGGLAQSAASAVGLGDLGGITKLASSFAPVLAGITAVASVWNKAFGRGPKEYADNSALSGMLGAGGFNGTVSTAFTQKGGWFRSTKRGVDSANVDSAAAAEYAAAYDAIKASSAEFARSLGLNADSIMTRAQAVNIALGKDQAANQKAIADFFGGVADTIAGEVLPSISQFQQAGESASAALQRVSTNFAAVDAILGELGTNSQTVFQAVGVASLAARERLVALTGGIEAFAQQATFFNQNFLTQAEQIAIISGPLNKQLDELGYAGITSAEQFKDAVQTLVQSGALATEQGAKTYAGLLAIAPQFKTVADYLKELSDAAAETAQNAKEAADALAQQNAEIAAQALSDNEQMLRAGVDSAFSAVGRAVEAQRKQVADAYESTMARLGASISSLTGRISEMQSLSDALRGALGSVESNEQQAASRSSARAQVQTAIAIAKASGVLPSVEDLKDALSVLGKDSADQFSSLADYQREVARTNLELETLGGITDRQLTEAQQQLRLMEDQKALAQLQYDSEIMRLDGILVWAQAQVDAINGVDRSVQSVVEAIAGLKVAGAALAQGATPSNPSGSTLSVEDLYQTVLGREGEKGGLDFWKNAFGSIVDADEYKEFIKGAQPELEMQERQRRQAEAANGLMSGTMSSKSETSNTQEMSQMKSDMARTADAVTDLTAMFKRVSADGNALLTEPS